nr:cysteine-rich CWC family protein [Vibrio eleionomae]
MTNPITTPCIAACKNAGGICSGCKRTIDEIVSWKELDERERAKLMSELAGEISTHTCPSCGKPAQCDIAAGKSTCWCFSVEEREPMLGLETESCLCRDCLTKQPIA